MCTISPKLYNKITEMVQENHPTISLTGFKNVGKATAVEALAKSNEVAKLLGLRENAAANKAKIIVTDCDEISAFDLFVHAKLCYKSLADFRNDYTLIYILYDMYEVYLKNGDYSETMKNSLKKYIASNDKTSFYYLTKFANESTIMKLCQILNKISMPLFDSWFKTLDSCVNFINTEDFPEFTKESYDYEDYINYILKPFIDESFRTGKVLFVIDSTCADEQLAKLSEIISYVTNPINLCILFTNVDNLMLSFADKYCSEYKFSEKFKVHWKNCYNDAYDFLNSLLNDFKDNLPDNNTVLFVEANLAALDLMINEELKSVVDNNGISYPSALLKSVNMLLNKNNDSKKPISIGNMNYF